MENMKFTVLEGNRLKIENLTNRNIISREFSFGNNANNYIFKGEITHGKHEIHRPRWQQTSD